MLISFQITDTMSTRKRLFYLIITFITVPKMQELQKSLSTTIPRHETIINCDTISASIT